MKFLSPIVTGGLPVPGSASVVVGGRGRERGRARARPRSRSSREDRGGDGGRRGGRRRECLEDPSGVGHRESTVAAPGGHRRRSAQTPAARRASAWAACSSSSSSGRAARPSPARSRSASRRTRRSSAAAARAGRSRSRCPAATPSIRLRRCCRGRAAPARAGPCRRRAACGRRDSRTRPAPARTPGSSSTSIATLPISRGPVRAHRVQVDQPDARQRLLAELVGVAEQLVAAAHGEDHARAGRDCVQRVALDREARSSAHSFWSRSWPPPM